MPEERVLVGTIGDVGAGHPGDPDLVRAVLIRLDAGERVLCLPIQAGRCQAEPKVPVEVVVRLEVGLDRAQVHQRLLVLPTQNQR